MYLREVILAVVKVKDILVAYLTKKFAEWKIRVISLDRRVDMMFQIVPLVTERSATGKS